MTQPNTNYCYNMTKLVSRFISLEDKIHDRPLASNHPSLNDYVPVNVEAWESLSYTTPLLKHVFLIVVACI